MEKNIRQGDVFFYFKKVFPFGTTHLVLFPFYLLIPFTKQCRSIFIGMMKLCQSSHQRNLRVHLNSFATSLLMQAPRFYSAHLNVKIWGSLVV